MAYLYQNTQGNCWDSERWKYVETTDGQPLRVRLKATYVTHYATGTPPPPSYMGELSVSGQDIFSYGTCAKGFESNSFDCNAVYGCYSECINHSSYNSMSELTDIRLIVENLAPSETLYFYELYRAENWTPRSFRGYPDDYSLCDNIDPTLIDYTWVVSQKSITGSGIFSAFGGGLSCGMDKRISNLRIVFCPNCCDCTSLITQKTI